MYCPICGQKQITEDTRFCSRCGFPLAGVTHLIANNGNLPFISPEKVSTVDTPRKKGVKRGLMIFLSAFLIVPIITIITIALRGEPFVAIIAAILFGVGGLLRMAYALLMESNENTVLLEENIIQTAKTLTSRKNKKTLPPQTSIPISDYDAPKAGHWRDTNEFAPNSIVENTTRQLRKDEKY